MADEKWELMRKKNMEQMRKNIDNGFKEAIKEPKPKNLEQLRKYVLKYIDILTDNEDPNDPEYIRRKAMVKEIEESVNLT